MLAYESDFDGYAFRNQYIKAIIVNLVFVASYHLKYQLLTAKAKNQRKETQQLTPVYVPGRLLFSHSLYVVTTINFCQGESIKTMTLSQETCTCYAAH